MKQLLMLASIILITFRVSAQPTTAPALARMPVKEITVFKDGHCLMLHSGSMPVDADGNVVLDYLPAPVLGTFWPYSADKNVKLSATVSGQRLVNIERTAITLRELIAANLGAEVVVTEMTPPTGQPGDKPAPTVSYTAKILSMPTRSIAELERVNPPGERPTAEQDGGLVLLKTDSGTKVVALDRIHDITFRGEHKPAWSHEEYRNVLTLKLTRPEEKRSANADVGMMYLQKGIRWIPHYKVTIDGKGTARVQLQATILNEMTDLVDVTANLVVGVPSFDFKETVDPIALQHAAQQVTQLSQYFQANSQTAYAMSNAIMSQAGARMGEVSRRGLPDAAAEPGAAVDLGPEVAGSQKAEDLFVFTVNHISLKKGQRMVIPVTEFTLSYKDVYTLDIPFAPPPDVRRAFNTQQQSEIARLFTAPKVLHKIRLDNKSSYPLTTAPAMILRDERVLGQGMMTYSPIGSPCDLALTTAVDIKVKKADQEAQRIPNAAQWQGDNYMKIELASSITLTSFSDKPVEIEITRNVLGNVSSADSDGKIRSLNLFEDNDYAPLGDYNYPSWWGYYSWPHWWNHFNGVSRIDWKVKLDPKEQKELKYEWSYFWR